MPDYHFTALDRSGQETTGQFSADDSEAAAERVKAMGLFAAEISELAPRKEMPPGPLGKYWDGTFWDAVQWIFWCVCMPIAGLIGGLNNPEKAHPAMTIIVAGLIALFFITKRVSDGKWPEGGEGGEGGGGE